MQLHPRGRAGLVEAELQLDVEPQNEESHRRFRVELARLRSGRIDEELLSRPTQLERVFPGAIS
jgi:hypothetical protein